MTHFDARNKQHPRAFGRLGCIKRVALRSLQVIGCVVLTPLPTQAATLQISPVSITFSPSTNASGLTLINPSDAALYGQVRVFRWMQVDGDDQLTPTDDLIASPPLLQIMGKSDQLVRLVKRQTAPAPVEQSYRLLVDELPGPDARSMGGVNLRLRYSVPVFVQQPGQIQAQAILTWHIAKTAGRWTLSAANAGVRHAQIADVTIYSPTGTPYIVTKGLLGYALAGAGRSWKIDLPANAIIGYGSKVHAMINAVPSNADITLSAAE